MAVNKVVYCNTTLIDITDSTVTKEVLTKGVVAYDKSGNRITGEFDIWKLDCGSVTEAVEEIVDYG